MKSLVVILKHFPNICWANFSQLILTINQLLISIIVIRSVGKEMYGDYLFVFAIIGILMILSVSGVRTTIVRAVAQGNEHVFVDGTKFSFLKSLLGIPILLSLGFYFFFYTSRIDFGITLMVVSFLFPFFISLKTWMFYLKGRGKFKALSLYNLLLATTQILITGLIIILTKSLIFTVLSYVVIESIYNVIFTLIMIKKIDYKKIEDNWKKQSYTLSLMDFSSYVFGKADIAIMSIFMPAGSIAIYGIVMKSIEAFFLAIKSTIYGILPSLYKKNNIQIEYFYKYVVASFVIPIGLLFPIKYAVLFFYGSEMLSAVFYIQIYLFVIPIYLLSTISNHFLVKQRENKPIIITKILAIIVVLILYFILIPLYGIMGGVISSIIYFVIQAILNVFFLNKIQKK